MATISAASVSGRASMGPQRRPVSAAPAVSDRVTATRPKQAARAGRAPPADGSAGHSSGAAGGSISASRTMVAAAKKPAAPGQAVAPDARGIVLRSGARSLGRASAGASPSSSPPASSSVPSAPKEPLAHRQQGQHHGHHAELQGRLAGPGLPGRREEPVEIRRLHRRGRRLSEARAGPGPRGRPGRGREQVRARARRPLAYRREDQQERHGRQGETRDAPSESRRPAANASAGGVRRPPRKAGAAAKAWQPGPPPTGPAAAAPSPRPRAARHGRRPPPAV